MLRTASQGGDGQAESSRRGADDEGAGDVAEGLVHRPLRDGAVKHVAERGPDGGRTGEGEPRKGTHLPGRPTYFMTSTSSRITRPSVMSSSRSGRKLWIASSVSTMITAIGRSSDSDRMRVVWMWLEAPYPSTPRNTDAPARPAR